MAYSERIQSIFRFVQHWVHRVALPDNWDMGWVQMPSVRSAGPSLRCEPGGEGVARGLESPCRRRIKTEKPLYRGFSAVAMTA